MYLVTNEEMRALDQLALREYGLPEAVLMETAGRSTVARLFEHWPHLSGEHPRPLVTVVGGCGNNGGDGWVVARVLLGLGFQVRSILVGRADGLKGAARLNYQIWRKLKAPAAVEVDDPQQIKALDFRGSTLIVEALFGTGLDRPLNETALAMVARLNQARLDEGAKIVSVDLPSGLNGDTGQIMGDAVRADLTVTLAFPKRGLFLGEGPERSGPVRLGEIGLTPQMAALAPPSARLITAARARGLRPPRPENGHKGTFGHLVVAGGSAGKTGALLLAAQGALRGGAGLVSLAGPASFMASGIMGALLEPLTLPLPESAPGQLAAQGTGPLLAEARAGRVLALGPGLGLGEETRRLTLEVAAQAAGPLVLDADALTLLAGREEILRKRARQAVLTPHPGEMARLLGITVAQVEADRFQAVRQLVQRTGAVVLLKGRHTLVGGPDKPWALNLTGGPHLAAGGQGDVLTGLIGALLAQGLEPYQAAVLGAFAHGLAGDLAAARKGPFGLRAAEAADHLPQAWRALDNYRPARLAPGLINQVEL